MTQSNHNDFVPGMAEIAREAGALLMEYFEQHVKIEYKGDADLVTVADRTSEILIRERIKGRWLSTCCRYHSGVAQCHAARMSAFGGAAARTDAV